MLTQSYYSNIPNKYITEIQFRKRIHDKIRIQYRTQFSCVHHIFYFLPKSDNILDPLCFSSQGMMIFLKIEYAVNFNCFNCTSFINNSLIHQSFLHLFYLMSNTVPIDCCLGWLVQPILKESCFHLFYSEQLSGPIVA